MNTETVGSTTSKKKARIKSTKTPAKKTVVKKASSGESKADKARAIMKKHYGKKSRKEIIELFIKEAGLTKAGSSTYYYNISWEMEGK